MIFKAHQLRHVIYADRFTWVLHHPGVGRRVEVCLQRAIRRQIQRLSFVGSVWWQCYDMDSVLFCLHNTIQCNVTFIVIHSDDDRFFSARTCEPWVTWNQAAEITQETISANRLEFDVIIIITIIIITFFRVMKWLHNASRQFTLCNLLTTPNCLTCIVHYHPLRSVVPRLSHQYRHLEDDPLAYRRPV